MANDEHVAMLKKGVDTWNAWRGRGFLCLCVHRRAPNWRQAPALVKLVMTTVLGLSAL